jgi:hypothetical protein
VKLTTPRLFLAMLTITIVSVVGGLIWVHEREPPEDPNAPPTGPSSVIRGVMKRAAARDAKARQAQALDLERLYHSDGGEPMQQ